MVHHRGVTLAPLHRGLDAFAIWTEDRLHRAPQPCVLAPPEPLDCFGPLPPLPDAPPRAGRWSAASPRAAASGDEMVVHAFHATSPRRGTVLLVPPWKVKSVRVVGGYTRLLARSGWDVWLLCPPHHLERTAQGSRSGEAFVSLDLARLRGAFEQLVVELRVLAALAATRGPVALVGLSLGALAGALAATAPEPLSFAALVAPTDLALVLGATAIGRRYRQLAARAGSSWPSDAELAAALAPFDPGARPLTVKRVFVAAGAHDRVSPVAGPTRLAERWGVTPRVYPRGHISLLFLCRALRRDLALFSRGGA